MLDQRGQSLRTALGFAGCSLPSYDRALWALRTWLDSWSGIGHVAVAMHRQGYDLQLTQYDDRRLARDVLHDRDGAPLIASAIVARLVVVEQDTGRRVG